MNKIILTVVLSFILIGAVGAYTVGQIFNQAQIDSIDVDSLNLGEGFSRNAQNKIIHECFWQSGTRLCKVIVNHQSIKPVTNNESEPTGEYEVVLKEQELLFRPKKFIELKNEYNLSYAKKQLRDFLVFHRDRIYEENLKRISNYQTKPTYDGEVAELLSDV